MFEMTIGSNNEITLDQTNTSTASISGEGTNEIVQTSVNLVNLNFGIILTPSTPTTEGGSGGA